VTTTYEYADDDPRTPEERAAYETLCNELDAAWKTLNDKCEAAAKKSSPNEVQYHTMLNLVNALDDAMTQATDASEIKAALVILDRAIKSEYAT